jgi:hypothetical protein
VSSAFLDKGEIVSTRGRNAEETQRFNARPGDLTSTRNHWSAKRALRRFWWTWDLVQAKGLAC